MGLLVGLLAGAAIVGGCSASEPVANPANPAIAATTTPVGACDATTVAADVIPSVVTIAASDGTTGSTGSGAIIRETGEIVTNNHVIAVAANAGRIDVLFGDGSTAAATITGRDPQTDLAVIKVDIGKPLPVIAMGTSSSVQIGQPVVAVGAPLGLAGTVTSGIVSARGRTVEVPADNGQTAILLSAVQTDAAINPGNSGGALTDCSGNLIGVNTANATVPDAAGVSSGGSDGVGFAIPVDMAKAVSDQLIATGTVTHAYLGFQAIEMPPTAGAEPAGLGAIYVTAVDPAGPAAVGGLVAGDVITAVDGQPVTDADQLAALDPGQEAGRDGDDHLPAGGRDRRRDRDARVAAGHVTGLVVDLRGPPGLTPERSSEKHAAPLLPRVVEVLHRMDDRGLDPLLEPLGGSGRRAGVRPGRNAAWRPRRRPRSRWAGAPSASPTPIASTSRPAGPRSSISSTTTSPSATGSSTRSGTGRACCTGSRRASPRRRCTRSACRPARRRGWRRCDSTSPGTGSTPTSCA